MNKALEEVGTSYFLDDARTLTPQCNTKIVGPYLAKVEVKTNVTVNGTVVGP